MDLATILTIASVALGLVLIVLTIVMLCTKNKATKETAQKLYDVISFIQNAIIQAEANINYTGADKFTIVSTKLKSYLLDKNLKLSEDTQRALIENEILLSNAVNVDKKSKNEQTETGDL